jgi:hypothetical protein
MKDELYYKLSFEFNYRILSGRLRIKYICESENTRQSRTSPCPRDADLRNGLHCEGGREHTYKTTSRQSLSK